MISNRLYQQWVQNFYHHAYRINVCIIQVGVAGVNALVFGSYTTLLQLQEGPNEMAGTPPHLLHVLIAGMGAGIITR